MEEAPKKKNLTWLWITLLAIVIIGIIAIVVWIMYGDKLFPKKPEEKVVPEDIKKEGYDVEIPPPGIVYQLSDFTVQKYRIINERSGISFDVASKKSNDEIFETFSKSKEFTLAGVPSYAWKIGEVHYDGNLIVLFPPPDLRASLLYNDGYYNGRVMYPAGTKIPTKLPVPKEAFTIKEIRPNGTSSMYVALNQPFGSATQYFPIGRIVNQRLTVIGLSKGVDNNAVVNLAPADPSITSITF